MGPGRCKILTQSFKDGLRRALREHGHEPVTWGLDGDSNGPLKVHEPSGEDVRLLMRVNLYINENLSSHGVTMNWTSILVLLVSVCLFPNCGPGVETSTARGVASTRVPHGCLNHGSADALPLHTRAAQLHKERKLSRNLRDFPVPAPGSYQCTVRAASTSKYTRNQQYQ